MLANSEWHKHELSAAIIKSHNSFRSITGLEFPMKDATITAQADNIVLAHGAILLSGSLLFIMKFKLGTFMLVSYLSVAIFTTNNPYHYTSYEFNMRSLFFFLNLAILGGILF
jgi:uncharacterized membrane protein YphA (DoxX/SURF4 family)